MKTLFAAALIALTAASCAPCEDIGPAIAETCVLPSMASDVEIEIEIREDCGTSCSEPPECAAIVDFNTVTVVASQSECRQDCVADGTCQRRTARCLIPPLSQGDYTVVVPGLPSMTLRAEPGAPVTCSL